MRPIYLLAALCVLLAFPQDAKPPILSAHDRIDGPSSGESHVSDLQVFGDGEVIYVKEENKSLGAKPEQSIDKATLPPKEVQLLQTLLATGDIRTLPTKIPSKTRPIDFSWQKSIEINRGGKSQKIEIEITAETQRARRKAKQIRRLPGSSRKTGTHRPLKVKCEVLTAYTPASWGVASCTPTEFARWELTRARRAVPYQGRSNGCPVRP